MTDSLLSSGEFSDLSEMSDTTDTITITPLCPICRKNYCDKVKPITLQPCGHGICSTCYSTLKDYAMQVDEDGMLQATGAVVLDERGCLYGVHLVVESQTLCAEWVLSPRGATRQFSATLRR